MNNIILLLTVGFVSNSLVVAAATILFILFHKETNEMLSTSHKVLYAKTMSITDKLNFLFKNLDIDESDYDEDNNKKNERVAYIAKNAVNVVQKDFISIRPNELEKLRGQVFDTIYIEESAIEDIDLKLFYQILVPMREKNKTTVTFFNTEETIKR